MNTLEDYYRGEHAWRLFADSFAADWKLCGFKSELIVALGGREDLAKVVFAAVGDAALSWIASPIPALTNLTPLECLQSESLLRRLKVMLMRMPFW